MAEDELIVTLIPGKTPFIGILCRVPQQAGYAATSWFKKPNEKYTLELEPARQLILWLKHEDTVIRHVADYEPVKLLKFLAYTKNAKSFNFGYVTKINEQQKIIRHRDGHNLIMRLSAIIVKPSGLESVDQMGNFAHSK